MSMDDYEKVKVVGRGAFGTVYLCRRRRTVSSVDVGGGGGGGGGEEVIVKQIPIGQLSAVDRQATLNEVRVLAMLHHPNIIEYHDSFMADKAMAIVMEYASGGNLYDFLEARAQQERYLAEEEIAHLFAQIVLPIQLVHSRQVLHRDLKTQNIFLTKTLDHVKIGDFGISKILSSKSKAYSVVGTPCYISPELCEGKPYNQKSDVWALGCVLYEMCTLKRAFEAPTLPALVLKIMRGTLNPLPADRYSAGLRQLLAMLLALEPADRPSAAQILSHPWLSPHVYRLPTSLGALPCTSRPPRPLSVCSPDELGVHLTDSPAFMHRRSISPFQNRQDSRILVWEWGQQKEAEERRLSLPTAVHDLRDICACKDRVLAVTGDGRAVEWRRRRRSWDPPRFVEGLGGIPVTSVATRGGSSDFFCCLLTDRGILLTFGHDRHGRLGHGRPTDGEGAGGGGGGGGRSVKEPRIVEALLGDEVTVVSCGRNHVAAVTSEGDVFGWGRAACVGLPSSEGGEDGDLSTPTKMPGAASATVVDVACGWEGTVVTTEKGDVLAAGRNAGNRFALDPPRHEGGGGGGGVSGLVRCRRVRERASRAVLAGRGTMVVLSDEGEAVAYGGRAEGGGGGDGAGRRRVLVGSSVEAVAASEAGAVLVVSSRDKKKELLFFSDDSGDGGLGDGGGRELEVAAHAAGEKEGRDDVGGAAISEEGSVIAAFVR